MMDARKQKRAGKKTYETSEEHGKHATEKSMQTKIKGTEA